MREPEEKTPEVTEVNATEEGVSVRALARYLRELSGLNSNEVTGNLSLARSLNDLATALGRHSRRSLADVLLSLETPSQPSSQSPKVQLPAELADLPAQEVTLLLADPALTKSQLVEIAHVRFGIPKGGLQRRKKEEIVGTISAAIDHEASLRIIAEQARQAGEDRTS